MKRKFEEKEGLTIYLQPPVKKHKSIVKKKRELGKKIMQDFFGENDFSYLDLKRDHMKRPCYVCPNNIIILETFSRIYEAAYDFLVSIAEPVSRTILIHEYKLTEYSLYAAVAIGLETQQIIKVLNKLSKVEIDESVKDYIVKHTSSYGKVRMILWKNDFYMESEHPQILNDLSSENEIRSATIPPSEEDMKGNFDNEHNLMFRICVSQNDNMVRLLEKQIEKNLQGDYDEDEIEEEGEDNDKMDLDEEDLDDVEAGRKTARFYRLKIQTDKVESVLFTCREINFPLLEEYDFRKDTMNKNLEIDLKAHCRLRPYQERALSKMFGSGSARSGLIVLPCGAGKTLVGIATACRIKKAVFIITISNVSVEQWRNEFANWTTVDVMTRVIRFTSKTKEKLPDDPREPCIVITTYSMVTTRVKKSALSQEVTEKLRMRDWGLMIMDEVHVAPAKSFRRCISIIKAHCKLGLTATLLREDNKTSDLYYLIGPKHYEANWLDLQAKGHLAAVRCIEVWCPMDPVFYKGYLDSERDGKKKLYYIMNPNKIRACEFLMRYHSEERNDKVIIFSDNVFALKSYAVMFKKPMIYGDTSNNERFDYINDFKNNPNSNVLFLSKVGDSAIDIPNASVIIQISSHFGSRRQEAQRLGRILRPKDYATVSNVAFFYTLVSKDTKEMFYSTKRQRFLIDQGYSFKVIDDLGDVIKKKPMYVRSCTDERVSQVLSVISRADHKSGDTEEVDEMEAKKGVRKVRKNLMNLSMFGNVTYSEFQAAPRKVQIRHPLFKKRAMKRKKK